ncbi:Ham1-like protein, putative [Plasmodium berghei]|uniref:Ham1-like protein, putative n=2 Tax=Plasmodium berghei TaxID=5821 RepID=A0A509AFB3_PLABA|nr:Ham1-like protein, putative [Plasmodium berghei ANKA]CXI19720.1 Ham1-like protein, putative [Plasmodium berghei]SCM19874.1 Ham1-like protein, putative [Plasmodium berghei]SCN23605.1 Ham1-like protein, putative [Plasmodium berghei]SCO59170.1 Ham1-like protein, putative [Plasmodium berghei]SCO59966.1 Ham1-like protein, putative [Plasmodium berghei]|eukprot:XP_034420683.1 Ham1-like protein, putative [Plasmodium berghei ANKA]
MAEIYLVTGNENKRNEFSQMMNDEIKVQFIDIDLVEIQSNDIVEINEGKAKAAYEILKKNNLETNKKIIIITDDTGLYMDCFNGFPGPYIKWMQKALGCKGIAEIALKLGKPKCQAVCVYSTYDGENVRSFKGATQGYIASPKGGDGFGWDKIFMPENLDKTFGEMRFEDKKNYSPRFKAFYKLKEFLFEKLKQNI